MSGSDDETNPKSLYAQVLVEDIFDALDRSGALTDEEVIAVLERIRDLLRNADGEGAGRALTFSERALLSMRRRDE